MQALSSVSLDVNAGQLISIEGKSGSGKSTLLNILGLLEVPSIGTYQLNTIDVDFKSSRRLARMRRDNPDLSGRQIIK